MMTAPSRNDVLSVEVEDEEAMGGLPPDAASGGRHHWHPPKPRERECFLTSRLTVFAYNLFMLVVLTVLLVLYFKGVLDHVLPDQLRGLAAYAVWFGALGGVATAFKGVYDHPNDWLRELAIWHYGRPFSGAIVGGVTLVLLMAVNVNKNIDQVSPPIVLALAFTLATQENRFFNFAYEVAKMIVQVPSEAVAPSISGIKPTEGIAKADLTLKGANFGPTTTVLVGGAALTDMLVSVKGDEIQGKVPQGKGAGKVEIVVTNPNAAAVHLPDAFEYTD